MSRLVHSFCLGSMLVLAACATPREACERDASLPYQAAVKEQTRIAQDLERGFTYQTEFEMVQYWGFCNRNGVTYQCLRRENRPVTKRVPINRAELSDRLSKLSAELPQLRSAAEASVRDCRAAFPEETP